MVNQTKIPEPQIIEAREICFPKGYGRCETHFQPQNTGSSLRNPQHAGNSRSGIYNHVALSKYLLPSHLYI